ncbi:hypothetical protein TrVE_jg9037 [Triparma verrucosa]|uniref:BspA family leucine-rich repeat surface protein n=1 Tax=Triparma verrucosa TaxID=1606542 RepID=A0A9W7EZ19_9STRA|nr:hypothetical protein TrVE_jg9037 [Triparma verrucosa]
MNKRSASPPPLSDPSSPLPIPQAPPCPSLLTTKPTTKLLVAPATSSPPLSFPFLPTGVAPNLNTDVISVILSFLTSNVKDLERYNLVSKAFWSYVNNVLKQAKINREFKKKVDLYCKNAKAGAALYGDISTWDVSSITSMPYLFGKRPTDGGCILFRSSNSFVGDLSSWDVSNVTNMEGMFFNVICFDSDLSGWEVSKCTNMREMFCGASQFNGNVTNWDASNVTDMNGMFAGCSSFTRDLSKWDVSSCTDMKEMFRGARLFNADISGWNVKKVKDMEAMFRTALSFSRDISSWNVENVTTMHAMFYKAISFDKSTIKSWNLTSIKSKGYRP